MSRSRQTSNSLRVRVLDALGRVDHHHRGIDRGQRAVGVFRKVLVARRVEQIEDAPVILERHHRGDDRDSALLLDRHPVRLRGVAVALGLDLAGELDGAAEQQQLLGQRGLAGVRMRDDGKGAPPLDFACERRFGFALGRADRDIHERCGIWQDEAVLIKGLKLGRLRLDSETGVKSQLAAGLGDGNRAVVLGDVVDAGLAPGERQQGGMR